MVPVKQPPPTGLILKSIALLDVGGSQFNIFIFLFNFSTLAFFIFSTLGCMYTSERNHISKLHDLIGSILLFSNEIFLFINQAQVCTLLEFLAEPIEKSERNQIYLKVVQDHKREVNFYSKIFTPAFAVAALVWFTASVLSMYNSTTYGNEECFRLVFGWSWRFNSDFYMKFINSACSFLAVYRIGLIYIAMLTTIISIKFKIRLLCADLGATNAFTNETGECLGAEISTVESTLRQNKIGIRTQSASRDDNQGNVASRIQQIKKENESKDLYLQSYLREKLKQEKDRSYLRNLVEQHVNILEKVKLTNQIFQHPLMAFHQITVIMVALAIPNPSMKNELLVYEYVDKGLEIFSIMLIIGCLNYLGQIMLDESELLRQALYNCDWADKPRSARQGLLIMMMMATKPLEITIGGIYTLGMETYGNVCSATYSYSSFMQSQTAKDIV